MTAGKFFKFVIFPMGPMTILEHIYIVTITKYLRCEYYKSALFLLSYNIILKYQACWFQREFKNQIGCPGSKITPACVQIPGFISCKYIDVVF